MSFPVILQIKPEAYAKPLTGITSFRLYQELHTHHTFEIELPFDHLESSATDFMEKAHRELVGKPIAIGIESDLLTDRAHRFQFMGMVTSVAMRSSNDFTGSFTICGSSPTCLLTDGVQKRTFRGKTLTEIVAQVLQPYPSNQNRIRQLKGHLKHTAPIPYAVQYNESNFDFLNRLLSTYREWFYFDGTQLCIGKAPQEETVPVFMDGYWSSFQIEAAIKPANTNFYAYDAVRHQHWQAASGNAASTVAQNPYAHFAVQTAHDTFTEVSHFPAPFAVHSTADLRTAARNAGHSHAASCLQFRGRTNNPNLRLGHVIDASAPGLGSLSRRTDTVGKYRIISLAHEVDDEGNYQNHVVAVPHSTQLPPANPHAAAPPAHFELADVIDLKDPHKLGRVRVRYHWPHARPADAESDWMRVITPYSGDGKGQLFVPELGSQLLVGYEQHRPDLPVALGNLTHANNAQKASYSPAGNAVKGFQTKGGNKITFHEKAGAEKIVISNGKTKKNKDTAVEVSFTGDGSIVLRTPGSILLSAGNLIQLSAREIRLEAEENIDLNGLKQINAATDDFKVDALKTATVGAAETATLVGQQKTVVESPLAVDVIAQGITDIQGQLIKLNS